MDDDGRPDGGCQAGGHGAAERNGKPRQRRSRETQPATKPAAIGLMLPKTVEITLYQGADKSWSAFTSAASPAWMFAPATGFADHVTTVDYRPASATQPATQAASQPATMP